jgi:hypothetical protein
MTVSCPALPSARARRAVAIGKVESGSRHRAHNGARRNAFVVLPRSYRPGHAADPAGDLPHGRGVTGRENVKLWGQLPAVGGFEVVSPDGRGDARNYSWGSAASSPPGAIALERFGAMLTDRTSTLTASMRSEGVWAGRRRCFSSRAIRGC